MNILVTGAAGQLGRAFRLTAAGSENRYFFSDICDSDGIFHLDIFDREALEPFMEKHGIDVIVNCASYTDVNRAEEEQEKAFAVNAEAVSVLASTAKGKDALLIQISTDYVFDGRSNVPYSEGDLTGPLNAYGRSKLAGEQAVVQSGCRYMIFRTAWMYDNVSKNFFTTIVDKTASSPMLDVVCDQVGAPTFAPDLAEAIDFIISSGMTDRTGIYHYSGEGLCSWYDFAKAICRAVGHLCDIRPVRSGDYPSKAVRPHYSVLDKSLIKKTFNIEIPHWTESLEVCVSEYMDGR